MPRGGAPFRRTLKRLGASIAAGKPGYARPESEALGVTELWPGETMTAYRFREYPDYERRVLWVQFSEDGVVR